MEMMRVSYTSMPLKGKFFMDVPPMRAAKLKPIRLAIKANTKKARAKEERWCHQRHP